MRYLVAVDESESARWAFFTALHLARDEPDELFVCTVVDDVRTLSLPAGSGEIIPQMQATLKAAGIHLVQKYLRLAHAEGLQGRSHGVVGVSSHAGEMVCQASEKKGVDVIVIGRRGMSGIKRLFMGSTSKHCVEHATCDVLVVKGPISRAEEHTSKDEAVLAEEAERARLLGEPRPGCPPASYIALKAAEAEKLPHDETVSSPDLAPFIAHLELERDEHPGGLPKGVAERID